MNYLLTLFITVFICINAFCQTLPAKSYYIDTDDFGRKVNTGKVMERYSEDSEGRIHGKYIKYHKNGIVYLNGSYINGKKAGQWQEFSDNNELRCFANYQNDKKNGLQGGYCSYNFSITNFTNDVENGEYSEYRSEVSTYHKIPFTLANYKTQINSLYIYKKGNYSNGIPVGKWLLDGQSDGTARIGNFKNGQYDGEWTNTKIMEDRDGRLFETGLVDFGEPFYAKGWKVIYQEGKVIEKFDNSGTDVNVVIQNKLDEKAKVSFRNCNSLDDYRIFIEAYPKSPLISKAKDMYDFLYAVQIYNNSNISFKSVKIPDANSLHLEEYVRNFPQGAMVDSAKILIAQEQDHLFFKKVIKSGKYRNSIGSQYGAYDPHDDYEKEEYSSYDLYYKNLTEYVKKFPNGIYNDAALELINKENEFVKKNIENIYNSVESLLFKPNENSFKKIILICDRISPFKNVIHDSFYYPLSLEQAFSYWQLGETDKTLKILKENINATIHYNNGEVKYREKLKDYYKNYRKSLQLKNEKIVWDEIKQMF